LPGHTRGVPRKKVVRTRKPVHKKGGEKFNKKRQAPMGEREVCHRSVWGWLETVMRTRIQPLLVNNAGKGGGKFKYKSGSHKRKGSPFAVGGRKGYPNGWKPDHLTTSGSPTANSHEPRESRTSDKCTGGRARHGGPGSKRKRQVKEKTKNKPPISTT